MYCLNTLVFVAYETDDNGNVYHTERQSEIKSITIRQLALGGFN